MSGAIALMLINSHHVLAETLGMQAELLRKDAFIQGVIKPQSHLHWLHPAFLNLPTTSTFGSSSHPAAPSSPSDIMPLMLIGLQQFSSLLMLGICSHNGYSVLSKGEATGPRVSLQHTVHRLCSKSEAVM